MKFERREDWPERLHNLVEARRAAPFAWGALDCVRFAADAVHAMTDSNPLDGVEAWTDEASATAALARRGGLVAATRAVLGDPIPPAQAQRGDVVLLELADGGPALGICLGAQAVGPSRAGLVWAGMEHARAAWSIGHG